MITVFRGNFVYRFNSFNSKFGTLTDNTTGIQVELCETDTIACNKRNSNIDEVIERYKEIELRLKTLKVV